MAQFTAKDAYDLSGETIELEGFTLTADVRRDSDCGTPWENCDGHGVVSEWVRRDKLPGELILADDNPSGLRGNTARRFYDFAATCKVALRDKWGFLPDDVWSFERVEHSGMFNFKCHDEKLHCDDYNAGLQWCYAIHRATFLSDRAYAAAAARADYEYLRAWCNDDWHYCGVIVTASRDGIELGSASLWGIESTSGAYLAETANELTGEAIEDAKARLASLCDCGAA